MELLDNKLPLLYTVPQLSEIFPLGKNSLYRLVNRSDFPKIRVGKKILIPADGLSKWLEMNMGNRF